MGVLLVVPQCLVWFVAGFEELPQPSLQGHSGATK